MHVEGTNDAGLRQTKGCPQPRLELSAALFLLLFHAESRTQACIQKEVFVLAGA
jgi:hypothetical protein